LRKHYDFYEIEVISYNKKAIFQSGNDPPFIYISLIKRHSM